MTLSTNATLPLPSKRQSCSETQAPTHSLRSAAILGSLDLRCYHTLPAAGTERIQFTVCHLQAMHSNLNSPEMYACAVLFREVCRLIARHADFKVPCALYVHAGYANKGHCSGANCNALASGMSHRDHPDTQRKSSSPHSLAPSQARKDVISMGNMALPP
jgi:hypothetical protein